jgi:hypothetical protein
LGLVGYRKRVFWGAGFFSNFPLLFLPREALGQVIAQVHAVIFVFA